MPLKSDPMQWVELRTSTRTMQLPVERTQLYRWWAAYLVRPCDVKPCTGDCGVWQPNDDAANARLLSEFRIYEP